MEEFWYSDGSILGNEYQSIFLILQPLARPRHSDELAINVGVSLQLAQLSLGEGSRSQSVMSISWKLPFVDLPSAPCLIVALASVGRSLAMVER